ncbi:hypothetical protein VA7868_04622 [Vibrio aerogenes CECT 7868]|uniref:Uncharacterized protein n=1 Tax=Vibrio aerogenes CECT 7868 TaxID=1216006 RepID=A0A1M6FBS3_9VIBR|nr:hypothetical protein VA7868_04622 [Vibrio aerogenes CECT 7868]
MVIISIIFIAFIIKITNVEDKTYIENGVTKLEGHPELKGVGGKAFFWFIDLEKPKGEDYIIIAYGESGAYAGKFKIIDSKNEIIKIEDIFLFDGIWIKVKNTSGDTKNFFVKKIEE